MSKFINLPAKFAGDRIFVHPITIDGVRLSFYTDTGGGGMFIEPAAVKRLGLHVFKRTVGNSEYELVMFPEFQPDASIPGGAKSKELLLLAGGKEEWDGFLGQSWFADRVWRFDYLGRHIAFDESEDRSQLTMDHFCPLGFLTDDKGGRQVAFPRIQATIDGEILDFLFDTGAMVFLTDDAMNSYFDDGEPAVRGTSFISHSMFETWRARHSDWWVIDHADGYLNESMIRVPIVQIAGYDVGPVWFTRRPDHNFHEYMSQWMDKRVQGALGGSIFRYFCIVVDYPKAVAHFQR